MNHARPVLSIAVLLFGLGMTGHVVAAEQFRITTSGTANHCQASLPVFDGNIRKRPLALVNEGDSSAFVTCSFDLSGTTSRVSVAVASVDGTGGTLSCTGVGGFVTPEFIVKGGPLPPSGAAGTLEWTAGDFAGSPSSFPNNVFSVSCNLQPGMGLLATVVHSSEDVGL